MNQYIYLQVGPIAYEISVSGEIEVDDYCREYTCFHKREIENEILKRMIHCDVEFVDQLSTIEGNPIYQNSERMIFWKDNLEQRLFAYAGKVYGIYREIDENTIQIEIDRKLMDHLNLNLIFIEMLAMEKYWMKEDAMVLHAAFIKTNEKAVLFTAPSGTGKSTQASLWNQYRNATIINGDRALIWKQNERYNVCGIPFCGSSKIHKNERMPLEAIVFLSQARENRVHRFEEKDMVERLYQELSINQWNKEYVMKSFDFIESLVKDQRMIGFECNMQEEAVDVLEKYLEKR